MIPGRPRVPRCSRALGGETQLIHGVPAVTAFPAKNSTPTGRPIKESEIFSNYTIS